MPNRRLKIWFAVLVLILVVFIGKLFYLQIIRGDYYQAQAQAAQLKEYSIPAERGIIKAYENGTPVPLVLNQRLYTLYADPLMVKDADQAADKLAAITSANAAEYAKLMKTADTRYVVLAKKLTEAQKNQILALKLPGVGTQNHDYRIYPQGNLAAQLLGFVNDDGEGKYGIEQALNNTLAGKSGMLKAITDAAGVPLAASRNNVKVDPKNGSDVVLTIDIGMQKQLENLLKAGLDKVNSKFGSALIIDPNSGAVKAMANWPTYDPARFYDVRDASVFNNAAVASPLEIGSSMKTLTASAALDLGVIKADTSFDDPGKWLLDGHYVTDIEEDRGITHPSISDVLNYSMNTGATWMLMQMGGQTGVVNKQARDRWHDYMVNHFQLGKPTGIEQGYEAAGYIPDPDSGYALQLTYANTSFGQALTVTPLQLAAAFASVVNGGTYYQPHLVNKKAQVVRSRVVAPQVGKDLRNMLDYAVKQHYLDGFSYLKFPDSYEVGGKTGTAQIANPAGGYYDNRFNGTYVGFVGGDKPQYVIVVRVDEPHGVRYAGSGAAQPIFADIAHMLINDFNVIPKSGS